MMSTQAKIETEQYWYFTWGYGQRYPNKYIRIFGTYRSAREEMVFKYGLEWCMQYDENRGKTLEKYDITELKDEMMEPKNTATITVRHPIIFQLFHSGKVVGWMRITTKVELSIDKEVWVDYDEGICEHGMALKWEGLLLV